MTEHRNDNVDLPRATQAFVTRWHARQADRARTLEALRGRLREALAVEAHAHGVTRVVLFGSAARGDFREGESDLDLLVDAVDLRDPIGFAADLECRLGVPVHVILRHRAPASLVERAASEGIEVHGT